MFRRQIRDEALKIVNGLENEAEVASARESSLRGSLNEVKTQASGQSDAEVKLRALEREAKAQRDLLKSYLGRYRDASARHDMGSVPAQATIVSRAHASLLPSFPKRGTLSLLVAVATALLALTYILARELIGAPAEPRERAAESRVRDRRRAPPTEPGPVPAAASTVPATPLAPAAKVAQPTTAQRKPEPAVAALPKVERKAEPAAADSSPATATQVENPLPNAARASTPAATAASAPPKPPVVMVSPRAEPMDSLAQAKPEAAPAETKPPAATQSAAGFLERLRRGLAPGETQTTAPQPQGGWLGRIRPARTAADGANDDTAASPPTGNMPVLRTNDLRHYLNQRLAASAADAANDSPATAERPRQNPTATKSGRC